MSVLWALLCISASGLDILRPPSEKGEYRFFELDNGLRVLLRRGAEAPPGGRAEGLAGAALVAASGLLDSQKRFPGLAHLLEHSLFLGSRAFPQPDALTTFASRHGGSANAFTNYRETGFLLELPGSKLIEGLAIFADTFSSPLFRPSLVRAELTAIDEEFRKDLGSDFARELRLIELASRPKGPLNRLGGGNLATLDRPGLMKALRAHFASHFSADKLVLVVSSPDALDVLEREVRDLFGKIPTRKIDRFSERKNSEDTTDVFEREVDLKDGRRTEETVGDGDQEGRKLGETFGERKHQTAEDLGEPQEKSKNQGEFTKDGENSPNGSQQRKRNLKFAPFFPKERLGRLIRFRSVGGGRRLSINFMVRVSPSEGLRNSLAYICETLASQSEGSLAEGLISEGLALFFSHEEATIVPGEWKLVSFGLEMTQLGVASFREVVRRFFGAVNSFSRQISASHFRNFNRSRALKFFYDPPLELGQQLMSLASNVSIWNPKLALVRESLARFSRGEIAKILAGFSPRNALVFLRAPDFEGLPLTEEHYKIEYDNSPFSQQDLEFFESGPSVPLPPANPLLPPKLAAKALRFIQKRIRNSPKDDKNFETSDGKNDRSFSIDKGGKPFDQKERYRPAERKSRQFFEGKNEKPVIDSGFSKPEKSLPALLFSEGGSSEGPRGCLRGFLYSPKSPSVRLSLAFNLYSSTSPTQSALHYSTKLLFSALVKFEARKLLGFAEQAGFEFDLDATDQGLTLRASGFAETLPLFLEKLEEVIESFRKKPFVSSRKFSFLREAARASLRDANARPLFARSRDLLEKILIDSTVSPSEALIALSRMKREEFLEEVRPFLQGSCFEGLLSGPIEPHAARFSLRNLGRAFGALSRPEKEDQSESRLTPRSFSEFESESNSDSSSRTIPKLTLDSPSEPNSKPSHNFPLQSLPKPAMKSPFAFRANYFVRNNVVLLPRGHVSQLSLRARGNSELFALLFQEDLSSPRRDLALPMLLLTERLLKESFFSELRTRKQLGYVVFAKAEKFRGVAFFSLYVQGKSALKARRHVRRWVARQVGNLGGLSEEDFANAREVETSRLELQRENSEELHTAFWDSIQRHSPKFVDPEEYSKKVRAISLSEYKKWFVNMFGDYAAKLELTLSKNKRTIRGRGVEVLRGRGVEALRGRGVEVLSGRGVEVLRGRGVEVLRGQSSSNPLEIEILKLTKKTNSKPSTNWFSGSSLEVRSDNTYRVSKSIPEITLYKSIQDFRKTMARHHDEYANF